MHRLRRYVPSAIPILDETTSRSVALEIQRDVTDEALVQDKAQKNVENEARERERERLATQIRSRTRSAYEVNQLLLKAQAELVRSRKRPGILIRRATVGTSRSLKPSCGLGLGDEGKGSFCRCPGRTDETPALVVRYNGGPQAAHHVVLPDGRWHCFAQLGAGMLQNRRKRCCRRTCSSNRYRLLREATHLAELG